MTNGASRHLALTYASAAAPRTLTQPGHDRQE
jgi:hypothetical protein